MDRDQAPVARGTATTNRPSSSDRRTGLRVFTTLLANPWLTSPTMNRSIPASQIRALLDATSRFREFGMPRPRPGRITDDVGAAGLVEPDAADHADPRLPSSRFPPFLRALRGAGGRVEGTPRPTRSTIRFGPDRTSFFTGYSDTRRLCRKRYGSNVPLTRRNSSSAPPAGGRRTGRVPGGSGPAATRTMRRDQRPTG